MTTGGRFILRPSVTAAEGDVAWMERGACKGKPTAVFFPTGPGCDEAAKAVCRVCPVSVECARYAMAIPDTVGVWGGTSEEERERMKRRRARSRVL